jgi:photosystem II stability/assembly factor-like uncharacterized protein
MPSTPLIAIIAVLAHALVAGPAAAEGPPDHDHWLGSLSWRCIGPSRGGRVCAVAGVRGNPTTYYMGATGGGVFKTEDAGVSWQNVSDGTFRTGSVGAIAVAESDPNVVYVGMGEACVRGNFSHGDGVYRSVDAGRTWRHVGLGDARQIGAIAVHPRDADLVYVAALGHVFGPNAERGVYRSRDGGDTWERVLFVDDRTGAVDVTLDPTNPRVLYAGLWPMRRTPWSLESGGDTGGLFRSTDGGDTWEELTNGLPDGVTGKIGVSASPARAGRVWAIVEADDGGVFRSDDSGDSWTLVNDDRALRQRAWYYTHVFADTVDPDTVYVLNVRFHKSIDGGRTYTTIRVPHGDNHDLWIDPDDGRRMINGNDGGANVSFNGGRTWSRQDNQPTAQFYHVATDTNFPYRVYGAQQDNSTVSISSRNRLGGREDFHPVGGGESGYIAPRPDDPDIVYAGSYGGYLTRYDHRLRKTRNITVWPENPMGAGAEDLVHRFQWTFPIVISPHDPDVLYVAGERLFRSTTEGASWEAISPDLTTDDETKQESSGGPITKDNTSVEYYCTIFAVAESPLEPGLIWAGTDDGLVHVTSDGGETWTDVTPPGLGDWPLISTIDASPHDADTAFLAVNRYKMDDFRPYVYRTTDRGATWSLVADGIDGEAFVRVVREDPERPGLLYAGTETGVWVSFDAGGRWHSVQLELPAVPVTDLVAHGNDLVASTQGRSFWILEGLTVLRQLDGATDPSALRLFRPAPAYRQRWDGVRIHFNLPDPVADDVALEIVDRDGGVVRSYRVTTGGTGGSASDDGSDGPRDVITAEAGMNLFRWDMRRPAPERVPGAVGWPSVSRGPRVVPGRYEARLRAGAETLPAPFEIRADPRLDTTPEEFAAQGALLSEITDALTAAHGAVNDVRAARRQIEGTMRRATTAGLDEPLREAADALLAELERIEETIIQTRSKAPQDPLNYPVRLNDKIAALLYMVDGDYGPSEQSRAVFERLEGLLREQLDGLDALLGEEVGAFNDLVHEHRVPAIVIE